MRTPVETLGVPTRPLAVITPSGNSVVERVTTAILARFPEISGHFSRTGVFGSVDPFPDDYDWNSMLGAARLLAHVRPEVIAWSGSKAGSIAFSLDHGLVERIAGETGVLATSSTLALDEVMRRDRIRRIAFVTPYTSAYQAKILKTFAAEGYEVVAEEHAALADNLAYASIELDAIRAMARRVATARPQAIIAWCTNFPAAPLVAELEAELGIPVYDSTSIVVWKALRLMGVDTRPAADWGGLFLT